MQDLLNRVGEATSSNVEALIEAASRRVPPLWPLESAIAVNPLAGFEYMAFDEAVGEAAALFRAQPQLTTAQWNALIARGDIDRSSLRNAAVEHLGGFDRAFEMVAPNLSRLDLLMARLENAETAAAPAALMAAIDTRFANAEVEELCSRHPSPVERAGPDMLGYARAFVAKWCAAFFDQRVAASPMPCRAQGLYAAVLKLAAHDPDFRRFGGDATAALIASAQREPMAAVRQGLTELGLEGSAAAELLDALVARLPGWVGHIRWRNEHGDPSLGETAPTDMADYFALWMLIERACALRELPAPEPQPGELSTADVALLAAQVGLDAAMLKLLSVKGAARLFQTATMPEWRVALIWMRAAELTYRDRLTLQLERAARTMQNGTQDRPDAQLVFCIDVRSEPFRRAIEARGAYETFGYAGFFGLPIAVLPPCGHARAQLPVLLKPAHTLELEQSCPQSARAEHRAAGVREALATLKSGAATSFATAEALGPIGALTTLVRTFAPRLSRSLSENVAHSHVPSVDALPLDAKIAAARGFFSTTGMSQQTARLVLLAGHGGEATNNPYASALDCGACGGHAGGVNARAMVAILNDPLVRLALAEDGPIPSDTLFVAGEHNTTTDTLTLFDTANIDDSHRTDIKRLEADLSAASATNRAKRATALGQPEDGALSAAGNWAEVRPEWALARNATFIVAPRALTKSINLEGRAFLHSYDWQTDVDSSALTLILTAPMVVAQWINSQYLFSTLDNARWGAGDKTTHNVMGGIGVVQGNGGDLCVGLPYQSLFRDDGIPHHVPQRLLTIVYAPTDKVETVVDANPVLQTLFGNGWVQLVVIDPETAAALRWRTDKDVQRRANLSGV